MQDLQKRVYWRKMPAILSLVIFFWPKYQTKVYPEQQLGQDGAILEKQKKESIWISFQILPINYDAHSRSVVLNIFILFCGTLPLL
jgi:hypothetical protein